MINYYGDQAIHVYYDHDEYKIFAKSQQAAALQLEQWLEPPSSLAISLPRTVIDIGCGTGTMLALLTERCHFDHVYGIDLSAEMLSVAQTKIPHLTTICAAAQAVNQHFPQAIADLLIVHFLFAYVEYKPLLAQTATVVKKGGLLSVCTTTNNSFLMLKNCAAKKIARVICRIFKINREELIDQFFALMPKSLPGLINDIQAQGYEVIGQESQRVKVSVATWREAWDFIHNAGWFVGALQQYKVTKWKVFAMFTLGKLMGVFPLNQGRVEDEMEIVVLTARRI